MNWNRFQFQDILIDELSVESLNGYTFNHLYSIVKLLSCSCIEFHELQQKCLPILSSNDLAIENVELNHGDYSS